MYTGTLGISDASAALRAVVTACVDRGSDVWQGRIGSWWANAQNGRRGPSRAGWGRIIAKTGLLIDLKGLVGTEILRE